MIIESWTPKQAIAFFIVLSIVVGPWLYMIWSIYERAN